MDPAIVASIVGGSCTIAAPIATLAVKAALEHRGLRELPNQRRVALRGTWEGPVQQPGVAAYNVTFYLKPGRKVITGELAFDHSRAALRRWLL
jgi:hypothetical protein